MIKNYWTLIAKKSLIDEETKGLVIGEILENVQFAMPITVYKKFEEGSQKNGFVVLPFDHELVSLLDAGLPNSSAKISIESELPNGKNIKLAEQEIKFGSNGRARNRFRSNGLHTSGSGKNIYRIFEIVDGQKNLIAECPLFIEIKELSVGFDVVKGLK